MTVRTGQNQFGAQFPSATYVVCLGCAKQFPYDWEQMQVIWTPLKPWADLSHLPDMPPPRARITDMLFRFWHALRKAKPKTA
jgi:hypothetical protein